MVSVLQVKDYMSMSVLAVGENESAYDAAEKMIKYGVGCILVLRNKQVAGLLTKGDIIKRVLLDRLDAKKVSAGVIMSKPVVTIAPEASLEDAARLMVAKNVTKLPVMGGGTLVGIITSTDILRIEPTQIHYLRGLLQPKKS
ncbi:MAG: CBS domain-containing protein [Nitrososphaerota archaeon]|nr:CBS domain-containing protein [Nitrososphaerota archaeon]